MEYPSSVLCMYISKIYIYLLSPSSTHVWREFNKQEPISLNLLQTSGFPKKPGARPMAIQYFQKLGVSSETLGFLANSEFMRSKNVGFCTIIEPVKTKYFWHPECYALDCVNIIVKIINCTHITYSICQAKESSYNLFFNCWHLRPVCHCVVQFAWCPYTYFRLFACTYWTCTIHCLKGTVSWAWCFQPFFLCAPWFEAWRELNSSAKRAQ